MASQSKPSKMKWYVIDLHLHTPASEDYQQPDVSYLDILHRAEARGLDMIAITDHNTLAGYRQMREEIHQLELLQKLGRILPEEEVRLNEYHRLLSQLLVLPGFEFTATFGFHILAIFPPEKPLREIEHLLLDLHIPPEQLDAGSMTVGASTDVLTAYRLIDESGGLVIAAHANSTNGVAMRGFPFGGQTKISFTQDAHLHALEVTDLEHRGPRTTAAFFNGTKPEYPRRMHCIQGSDAHRLSGDPQRKKNLGVGERVTEVLLPELSFAALRDLFHSNDFARTRPRRQKPEPTDNFILAAREDGANIIQDFHENMTVRGGKRYAIIADVCAFANTNGGTLYIGLSADPKKPILGVPDAEQAVSLLDKEISNRISPPLKCTLDIHELGGKKILRILVPRGEDPPYAVDDNKIYVRFEGETGLAVRDEIVGLVLRSRRVAERVAVEGVEAPASSEESFVSTAPEDRPVSGELAPRTGVEVVSVEERDGGRYYTVRDLRNGNMVKNVTRKSARRLWHYAITAFDKLSSEDIFKTSSWYGDFGLLRRYRQGKGMRYDLAQRVGDTLHYYFGVTEDGVHGPWRKLVGQEEE